MAFFDTHPARQLLACEALLDAWTWTQRQAFSAPHSGQKANTSEINPGLIRWTGTRGSHSSHLVMRLRNGTLLEMRQI